MAGIETTIVMELRCSGRVRCAERANGSARVEEDR